METKVLVILVLFVGSSLAQDIECIYRDTLIGGTLYYTCELVIQNPNGFDNYTAIVGTHLPNRTDVDVKQIYRSYNSKSTIFPQILCSRFENLEQIEVRFLGLEMIFEESFRNCVNLEELWLHLNSIEDIHEQAFLRHPKLALLIIGNNRISRLSDGLFDNLVNLKELDISFNPLESIPDELFKNLINLESLYMDGLNLNALNPVWFENIANLGVLTLSENNFTSISEQTFSNVKNLWALDISRNPIGNNLAPNAFYELRNLEILVMESIQITQINSEWFQLLQNLKELHMYNNSIALIDEGAFDNLSSLTKLRLVGCRLTESIIPGNLFSKLSQLTYLDLNINDIQILNSHWFQNLPLLTDLHIFFNQISDLPIGIFNQILNLETISLAGNNLEVISRNAFGNLSSLGRVELGSNSIKAIDERFLREATSLMTFQLYYNLCISDSFYNFASAVGYLLQFFEECTANFNRIVESATEQGQAYRFYSAPTPGIQLSVNTDQEFRIALTPFNMLWTPSIEILIGTRNNTVSTIIRNQNQEVAVANSPNIIKPGQSTRLRITWANHLVLVTIEGQDFPFLGSNLQDIFPVNFYGLRSPESHAVWRIQPINW